MRRVIRRDDIQAAVTHRLHQCFPVDGRLDRRVALYSGTEVLVAAFIEPQVMNAHFAGYTFLIAVCLRKLGHLDGGRKVQYVKERIVSCAPCRSPCSMK